MNRVKFPISAVCCLTLIVLLFLSIGAVSAQSMDTDDDMMMDDTAMDDDMMMDDMAMDDDMMMQAPRICEHLPSHIAVYGDAMSVNCRDVGAAGIGVQSIVDAGVISAVDIWSSMAVDVEFCSSVAGSITVLDAASSPRMAMMPAMYSRNNLSCVHLSGAGTVVLAPAMMMDDMAMDDDMMMDDMAMDDDMMMDDMAMDDDMMMDDDMAMDDDMMMDDDMAMGDDMMMDDDMAMDDDMMMDDDMAMGDDMVMDDDMAMDDDMMMPAPRICEHLPGHIAVFGDAMSVNCRDVGPAGIGVQSVIDAGVISAIDIWSSMAVDVEVCSSIAGSITVLDAASSPRMAMMPAMYSRDNLSCVHLSGAGTVVLAPAMMMDDMAMDDDMMMDDGMAMDDDMMMDDSG